MRELHVVALSEDGRSVLLATSKKATTGGFRLKLDDKIRAALKGDLPRPGESAVRSTGVSPKEIQARMRAGESAEEIAASAGVPVARIERFAGPVLSERERIIEEARAGFLSRGRLGPSLLPLGDAVDAALAETPSLRPETVSWTARRLDSGHWLVQVSYVSRARTRTGSWVYDPGTRALVPSDPASAALGHTGEEAAARKSASIAAPRPAAARARPAAKKKPAKKAAGSRAARSGAASRTASARPAGTRTAATPAKKAAAKQAAARKAVATKAAATKAAATKRTATAAKQPSAAPVAARGKARGAGTAAAATSVRTAAAAAAKPAGKRTAAPAAPAVKTTPAKRAPKKVAAVGPPDAVETPPAAEPESPPTLRVVPAPPAELVPTPVPKRRAAGERATVPDWADVLFGTAPRSDRNDG